MSIYVKIENLKYNGSECYYKDSIDITMHQATIFNEHYIYYYKNLDTDFELLGKFKGYTKISSGSRHYDVDFEAYGFEHHDIITYKKANIFCTGISAAELDEKMIYLDTNITYNNCPVYYKTD
jgi:hypothetical protein